MQTHSERSEWLTPAEVCEVLQIGRTLLWGLTSSGELPASKVGRLVRIHRDDLEAFMERNRVHPDEPAGSRAGSPWRSREVGR